MIRSISGTTALYGLFGHPASHSISPAMHNTAFQKLGIDAAYLAFDIREEQIEKAVSAIRTLPILGVNLTMPLKTAVIPFLDALSEASALSGSVNTIVNDNGFLTGHTTDGIGFTASVREAGFEIKGSVMSVLGAGGAAGSLIVQSAIEGAEKIFVFKRSNASFKDTVTFCQSISEKTGCPIKVLPMEDGALMQSTLDESGILVNATPVGMGDDKNTPVPREFLAPHLFVSDLIYHPEMTPLLSDAKDVGCRYSNGKYMLLHQGAASFRLWTGENMPVELVRKNCF